MLADIYLEAIKKAKEEGKIGEVFDVTYNGKAISLNDLYSQGHWSKRSSIKSKYRSIFDKIIAQQDLKWLNKFSLLLLYNSRHDVDNTVGMEKIFVDSLKREEKNGIVFREGFIKDDSRRYFKGLCIFPVNDLPMNTFKFILIEEYD